MADLLLHPDGDALLLHADGDALSEDSTCCCVVDDCTKLARCLDVDTMAGTAGRDIEITFGGIADHSCSDCNEILNNSFIISEASYEVLDAFQCRIIDFIFVNVCLSGTPTPLVIAVLLSLDTLAGIFAVSVELENPGGPDFGWFGSNPFTTFCAGDSLSLTPIITPIATCDYTNVTCSIRLL